QISTHFSEIADLLGNPHYTNKFEWSRLREETKGRKVSLVVLMINLLCTFVAPDGVADLTDRVVNRLSSTPTELNSACARQVLDGIGEKIIDAPTRRAKIETLAMIVDLPFFSSTKVLTTIPTVTRHLIYKARMFNRGGVNFDEKFIKVRYDPQAVDFFVSFVVRFGQIRKRSVSARFSRERRDIL
ncbi:hypothetical protein PFISCL1PPCAC_7413, partial [Pristionchus fissidentatus]